MTEKLAHEFTWEEVARALFAEKGISKGWWRVAVKMNFGAQSSNWPKDGEATVALPTGVIGIAGLALFETDTPGALTFDAATGKLVEVDQVASAKQKRPAAKKATRK